MSSHISDDEEQTEEGLEQKITEIISWVHDQKFDKPPDERRIRKFLIGSKGRVEKAKTKLSSSADFRKSYPHSFENRDPLQEVIVDFFNSGFQLPLPVKDRDGQTILLCRPYFLDSKTHPLELLMKAAFMGLDVLVDTDDNILKKGLVTLVDLDNCSFSHMLQLTPRMLYQCMRLYRDGYPILFKGLHIFNAPGYLRPAVALFKTFLPSKMKKRFFCHGSMEDVYKHFDKNVLPKEYGGESPLDLEQLTQRWKQAIVDHRQRFLDGDL